MLTINTNVIKGLDLPNNKSFRISESVQEAKKLFVNYFDIKAENQTESFDSTVWTFKELTNNHVSNFDFSTFSPLIAFNNKINDYEFILAIKCWTINNLNTMTPTAAFRKISNLYAVCHLTNGLNSNFEELIELVSNGQIYSKKPQSEVFTRKSVRPETLIRYINSFISFCDFYDDIPVSQSFIGQLLISLDKIKYTTSTREIPRLADLINFKDCIETFYKEMLEQKNEDLLIKYYPIIIWWKLTSVIPMRPSEFCLLKRDCIQNNNISFPRLKQRRNNPNSRNNIFYDSLPISEELIKIITHYKVLTNRFNNTSRLFSFDAFLALSLQKRSDVDYTEQRFTPKYLNHLLNLFYQEIVIERYNLEVNEMLKPGDLRHIAITSMMLQGYDRVEIERLSGHYEINSHYSYANHMHYWVDTEIQILANQFKLQENTFVSPHAIDLFNNLSDDILYAEIDNSEPQTDEYIELELGYCMDVTMPCPTFNWEYTGCYFCENWWISHHELEKNKNRIVKELSTLYNDLHRKINYLSGLYNLHQLNEYGQINPDIQTELNQTTQEIKRDKITLAKLKYMLESEDL